MKRFDVVGIYACAAMAFSMLSLSCASLKPKRTQAPHAGCAEGKYTFGKGGVNASAKWWKEFDSKELDSLVAQAFEGNLSLKEAYARLKQARATAIKSGADLYPALNFTAGASRVRSVTESKVNASSSKYEKLATVTKEYSPGLAASYELDLWGRVRDTRNAAVLDAEASLYDYETAGISLTAEIVNNWLSLIEQRALKKLLQEQIETNKTYLDLVELRWRKSSATALDVYQQRQKVAQSEAQLPLVIAGEKVLLNELAVLLGKPATSDLGIKTTSLPVARPLPAVGVPADLLINRPDIRSAFADLEAADFRVAAARASRLPTLSLTGSYTYKAAKLDDVLKNWYLNLASSLTAPIFDGRSRSSEVKRTLAVSEEKLHAYRETVLTAVKEVENALANEDGHSKHIELLGKQIDFARKALEEARERYQKGASDYLPVLTQLETLQTLEQSLISRKREVLSYRVTLYRSLGGDWNDISAPEAEMIIPGVAQEDLPKENK